MVISQATALTTSVIYSCIWWSNAI